MEKIGNPILDQRIGSLNYMLEMSLSEYYDISQNILDKNIYQRKRVKSSATVYSLLKQDLNRGCIIPPIVMALTMKIDPQDDIIDIISKSKNNIIIIDGLQRSYTIRDLVNEIFSRSDSMTPLSNKIRVELYTGINKLGILYRMLTLNTGQTQMSTRHQIEIIYSDYIDQDFNGIKLIRQVDDVAPKELGEYSFRDVIEGFTSYIEKEYLTLDRFDILENIKSLEKFSKMMDTEHDIFKDFISTYNHFVEKIHEFMTDDIDVSGLELQGQPFGKDVVSIFKKSQSLTGFGAGIGKLIEYGSLSNINNLNDITNNIQKENIIEGLQNILVYLDKVRSLAKKIGNDQRLYFFYLYRKLFDKQETESYCNLSAAAVAAFNNYCRETQ
jgi:hypothetical protein